MANQSDYMKNRLLQKNQEKVINARRMFYAVASYAAFSGILLLFANDMMLRGIINLLFALFFFVLGATSSNNPITLLRIGFTICLIMAILSILGFKIFPAFVFSMAAYFIYIGIDGAKYLANQAPAVIENDEVLDANMWNDEDKK
ncbi:MAG: DUF2700 domain-containing protein [Saprospiraceae bacterium]